MFDSMSTMEILKLLSPILIVNFALMVFCLFRLSKDKVRYLPKWGWAPVIMFVTFFGSLFFLILGRERD